MNGSIIDNELLIIEELCAKKHFDEITPKSFSHESRRKIALTTFKDDKMVVEELVDQSEPNSKRVIRSRWYAVCLTR